MRAATISEVPQPGQYVNDDAIYRRVFYRMHAGRSYYEAFRDAWTGLKNAPPLPATVPSYRLPTLYWLWGLLPPNAFYIVIVFLLFASGGCVGAALVAGQLAGARFAPLAALAYGAYAMAIAATVYVTYVDLPAASIAVIGVALFVRARVADDRRFLWAAALVLVSAALMREILAYLIVLAAVSTFFEAPGKRWRTASPWLAAGGVFALGYSAHAYSVMRFIPGRTGSISYLKGSPAFALDAIRRFSDMMTAGGALLPILFLFALLGAWASGRRLGTPFGVFAVAALALPLLAMVKFGNPGIDAAGLQVNYWGLLVVPLALALWPAAALWLPDTRWAPPRRADQEI